MLKIAKKPLPSTVLATEQEVQLDQQRNITNIAGSATLAGIGDFTNGVLRYITNVLMTHMVAPSVYGVFGEVSTAMFILGWIIKLGFDGVMIRLLPAYRVNNRQDLANGLARFTIWITLISGLVVSGLIFAFAAVIARLFYHNPSYRQPLQEVAILVLLTALQWVLAAGLQAYKEIKWKVYVDRFCQPLITLITLVILYLLGLRLEALSFSAIVGYFCSILIGQVVLSKILKRNSHHTRSSYIPRVWLYNAIPMLFNGLIFGILNSADILFLSLYATSVQAGIYIATDRVSSLTVIPLVALNMIFSPIVVEYHTNGKHEQLASMLKLVTKWSFSLSLPVFLASLVFHDAILGIFGPQYTAGGLALMILCIGNMVNAGTGSVLQLLAMTGHLRIVSINSTVTICVNAVLSFILVPHFAILGAALAVALAEIMLNAMSLIEVYWIMKIHPYRWDIYKPLLAGGVAFGVGVLLVHFVYLGPGRFAGLEELALLIPFAFVYCLVMVLLRFSKEDQIVFDMLVARFGKKRPSNT